jgi:hypothetical protein
MKKIVEIFGWYGMIAILGAYFLISFEILESTSLIFQFLNITGAIGIVAVSLYKKAYQPGVLNIIWAIIALLAILRILF